MPKKTSTRKELRWNRRPFPWIFCLRLLLPQVQIIIITMLCFSIALSFALAVFSKVVRWSNLLPSQQVPLLSITLRRKSQSGRKSTREGPNLRPVLYYSLWCPTCKLLLIAAAVAVVVAVLLVVLWVVPTLAVVVSRVTPIISGN